MNICEKDLSWNYSNHKAPIDSDSSIKMTNYMLHSSKLTANAPKNRPSQKEIHLPTIDFAGAILSFREGIIWMHPCSTVKIGSWDLH